MRVERRVVRLRFPRTSHAFYFRLHCLGLLHRDLLQNIEHTFIFGDSDM
jgi:hypothetical protein